MTDRDALIERMETLAFESSPGNPQRTADLRWLISLASPSLPELGEGWEWVATPTAATIDRMKADVQSALASPSPAQTSDREAGEWVNRGEGWEWISTSPAQWPEDVVERATDTFLAYFGGECRPSHKSAMRAALATLPPPEDERVKGLVRALETIDYIVNADTDWPADDVIETIESALASYRGGA